MIYFLVFFSSEFFYWRGVKCKNQYIRHIMLAAAVLILALMAGLRDYTVGTDVGVYGLYAFEKARQYESLWKLITNFTMSIEPGYAVIAYLSSRISSDPHVFFFLIGAIIYSLVAKAVYDFRNQINATMAWFLYLFLFSLSARPPFPCRRFFRKAIRPTSVPVLRRFFLFPVL